MKRRSPRWPAHCRSRPASEGQSRPRASGLSLRKLRWIALLETAVPLVFTALARMGTVLLIGYLIAPNQWSLPSPGFLLGMAGAVLTALAVCLITWPLMDAVTPHGNVRFE